MSLELNTPEREAIALEEDALEEQKRSRLGFAAAMAPFVVASFADTKWVIAVGLSVVIASLYALCTGLDEISVRLKRTNLLLAGSRPEYPILD
jgi:hypothetical protein